MINKSLPRPILTLQCFWILTCLNVSVILAGKYGTVIPQQTFPMEYTPKSHTAIIESHRKEYRIAMGGNVDMDHAWSRQYGRQSFGFQPNESIVIANIGDVDVQNAKLIINDRGDWYTIDGILSEALGSAKTDQEKVYLIWYFTTNNRHHDDSLWKGLHEDELHDPVKMFCIYGGGFCDDTGKTQASLWYAAGLDDPEPFERGMHGHVMSEVFCNQRWQFMDADEGVFYLDHDNELPVSGDMLAHDHSLMACETVYNPEFNSFNGINASALMGADDERSVTIAAGHQIRVDLRPGEKIEYRWDNIGKWSMFNKDIKDRSGRRYVGNSRLIYEPFKGRPLQDTFVSKNLDLNEQFGVKTLALTPGSVQGSVVYRMTSSFVFCGGEVSGSVFLPDEAGSATVEVWAAENKGPGVTEPIQVWQGTGKGTHRFEVNIDQAINPFFEPPEYEFFIQVNLDSPNATTAALTGLAIRGDILVSLLFLPRLKLGDNKVVYTDQSPPGAKVRVTYRWRETTAVSLPQPPALIAPADGVTLHDDIIQYRWEPVPSAQAYHIQVCRDPQMRWPYRAALDVYYDQGTEYAIPYRGVYTPDTTYYWHMRTRNHYGIWSDWSQIQTFRWSGPRIPVDVKIVENNGTFRLCWKPNPRGVQAVRYEVYGCDIKGFIASDKPYETPGLETQPSNYLGRTTDTEFLVAGQHVVSNPSHGVGQPENLNRCFYRVVAVDDHGTHSGPSPYAEMPHPYIWTQPNTQARIGEPYSYQPQTVKSMGDLQYWYDIGNGYWDKERLSYSLENAPDWLKIDSQTGRLSGTPSTPGRFDMGIDVTASTQKRTGRNAYCPDIPDKHYHQKFVLNVQ